jgi:hypothetical protein
VTMFEPLALKRRFLLFQLCNAMDERP